MYMHVWMMDRCMYVCIIGWMIDGLCVWMNGRVDKGGWMDEWMMDGEKS